jgi:VanZ family protein
VERGSSGPELIRRVATALACVCVAAVIYISLRPFTFTPAPWHDTLDEFIEFTFRRRMRLLDMARNVIALVPLGFFLAAAAAPDGTPAAVRRRALRVLGAVALLSASMEVGQAFVRVRIVSGRDVAAQVAGSSIGVALWAAWGRRIARGLR